MSKVFDTNLYFKILGLFYGDYDGYRIVQKKPRSSLYYVYSKFWFYFIGANVIRYTFLTFYPRRTVFEFYFCDYAQLMDDKSYRWMMSAGPLFNSLLLFQMRLFNSIQFEKKARYWLKFLQIPKTRCSTDLVIDGFSNEQVKKFWRLSSLSQHYFIKSLAIMGSFTMSLACLNYVYSSKINYYNIHPPHLFWIIAIANYCTLLFVGVYDFTCSFGLIIYLYLTSKLLMDRFDSIKINFQKIAYTDKKLNLNTIDKMVRQFNLIIVDLEKCNFIFSRFNFLNYFYGIFICSILLMISLFSINYLIVIFAGILFLFTFIPVLLVSFAVCGALHNSVKANHQPIMKLLERKEIKSITVIRILRTLDWISSDHATFRCLNLFPMKKVLIVEVFFSIIAQSILIYDITFNMF